MFKPLPQMKSCDWSINLEDEPADGLADLLDQCVSAIRMTSSGYYVNLVTPGTAGHPEEWLIKSLSQMLQTLRIPVREIQYIDECGCGGYVTRVHR